MMFKILRTSALILVVTGSAIWAQSVDAASVNPATHTLTIKIKGTIGPVLSGTDPLGFDGKKGMVTVLASESLSPTKHTATSATYTLPPGAIKVTAGSNKFTTKSPSKMMINLTSTADILTLVVVDKSTGLTVTDTTYLKAGSWTTAVLKHPGFQAVAANPDLGDECDRTGVQGQIHDLWIDYGSGFNGTGASSSTVDPVLPEEDLGEYDVEQ